MSYPTRDLAGQKFGRLTAVSLAGSTGDGATWLCTCECGGRKIIRTQSLVRGRTRSCGCLHAEANAVRVITHGATVGGKTPEYRAYIAAKKRCTNPNTDDWPLYGGRGIRFLFSSFQEFLSEIGPKPSPEHSIDRKDPDGDYCIGNVRWATAHEQRVNQRPKGSRDNSTGAV